MATMMRGSINSSLLVLKKTRSQTNLRRADTSFGIERTEVTRPSTAYPALLNLSHSNPLYEMVDFLRNTGPAVMSVLASDNVKPLKPKASSRLMRSVKVSSLIRKTSRTPIIEQQSESSPALPENVIQCVSNGGCKYLYIKTPNHSSREPEQQNGAQATVKKPEPPIPSKEDKETDEALQTWISSLALLEEKSTTSQIKGSTARASCSYPKQQPANAPEGGSTAAPRLSHSSAKPFQPKSRNNSIATLWPSFDGISPSALDELVPAATDSTTNSTDPLHKPGNTLENAQQSALIHTKEPQPHMVTAPSRSYNRLSKSRKYSRSRQTPIKIADGPLCTPPPPGRTVEPVRDEKAALKDKDHVPPTKSSFRGKNTTFSLIPRLDPSPAKQLSTSRPNSRQQILQNGFYHGRGSSQITQTPLTSFLGPITPGNSPPVTVAVTDRCSVDSSSSMRLVKLSLPRQTRKEVKDPLEKTHQTRVRDSLFYTPPRETVSPPSICSAGTACDSRPISGHRHEKPILGTLPVTVPTGGSFPSQQTHVNTSNLHSVVFFKPLGRGSQTGGTSSAGRKRSSSAITGEHVPISERISTNRLEARVEALERDNKLLEAALMAVLRTSGRLNGCPCSFEKGGISFSDIQSHQNLSPVASTNMSIRNSTSSPAPSLALHPYFNPAFNTPRSDKRVSTESDITASSVYSNGATPSMDSKDKMRFPQIQPLSIRQNRTGAVAMDDPTQP